jgi:chemotaxis protein MotB
VAVLGRDRDALAAQIAMLEADGVAADAAAQLDATQAAEALARFRTDLGQARATIVALETEVSGLRTAVTGAASVREQLAAALAAKLAAETARAEALTEAEQKAALLSQANTTLSAQVAQSAEAQRKIALLNEQVAALRGQLGALQGILDESRNRDSTANVQIQALGNQLNAALAQVASEERRRASLEEAERRRLEEETRRLAAEAKELSAYRSDFFGRLRQILGDQEGVRVVGDRFVFSSEVLFPPGGAELSAAGQQEMDKIATILRTIAVEIPSEIDWVIRVDGHTDNVPLSGEGAFVDNWELSQARALSVVRYMVGSLGIAPDRLSANGFGQYQPINPDGTPEARAQNRRIELKLTEK